MRAIGVGRTGDCGAESRVDTTTVFYWLCNACLYTYILNLILYVGYRVSYLYRSDVLRSDLTSHDQGRYTLDPRRHTYYPAGSHYN